MKPNPTFNYLLRGATFTLPAHDPCATIGNCPSFHRPLVAESLRKDPFGKESPVRGNLSVTALRICKKLYFEDIFSPFLADINLSGIPFSESQIASFATSCSMHLIPDGQTLLLTNLDLRIDGEVHRNVVSMTRNSKSEIGAIDYPFPGWHMQYSENKHQLIVPTWIANIVFQGNKEEVLVHA